MSRKLSSKFSKSKQVPRIFQRRNPAVRSVVRNGWNWLEGVNNENNTSSEAYSHKNTFDDKSKKSVAYLTRNVDSTDDATESKIGGETSLEKNNGETSGNVDDIEKWLKTRTESVSSIDLDAMKSTVEEAEQEEEEEERTNYLADDLPHAFLGKDPDGLSIDIDLSDKKLNLDYDPLLREMRSDKLLEVCEKNDDFIPPEFRLDHLDPLVLSPHDMMVAGEMLPSASHHNPVAIEQVGNLLSKEIRNDNDDSSDSKIGELIDRPIQAEIDGSAEELEQLKDENKFEGGDLKNLSTKIQKSTQHQPLEKSKHRANSNVQRELKSKNVIELKATKKQVHIRPKPEGNNITFLDEPCPIDGKDGVMAVVAISTDNISNTTQIVINTGMNEQIYQGKTSELIEATGNLTKFTDTGSFSVRDKPHERMVSKALEELGITDESLEPTLVNENGRIWLCPRDECNREFCKLHALKTHLLAHYGVRPFKCDYAGCTWAFHSEFKLKRHKETHLKRKNFVCEVAGCNRRFTTVYNLWSHEKLHTRPNRIICQVPECQEKFQTKRALELHMKNHDQSHAPYVCNHEDCGKRYYTSNALTSHQRCHNYKEIDVKCSWPGCGKIFDKPCRLKAHVRSHTGSKPYTCDYQDCQWAFSSSSKLKRHQKKHTNERKYACNVDGCGKAFMRSEHLKEHLLTHGGGGYFQCYICDAHFSAKSSLYVHIKKHQVKEAVNTITDSFAKNSKQKKSRDSGEKKIVDDSKDTMGMEKLFVDPSVCRGAINSETNVCQMSRKIVRKKERKNLSYSCGVDGCGKMYNKLSSLATHMIASHGNTMEQETPIGISSVSETSDLDYIMYTTQTSNSKTSCRTMMIESCDAIIMNDLPKDVACLPPEPEPPPAVDDHQKPAPNSYRTSGEKQIFNSRRTCQGSARTGLTYEDVWKLKIKTNDTETTNVGASDVVLGEANLEEGLLLTEELPSIYYQDEMVGTECQILLLDGGSSDHPIDLRGLE